LGALVGCALDPATHAKAVQRIAMILTLMIIDIFDAY